MCPRGFPSVCLCVSEPVRTMNQKTFCLMSCATQSVGSGPPIQRTVVVLCDEGRHTSINLTKNLSRRRSTLSFYQHSFTAGWVKLVMTATEQMQKWGYMHKGYRSMGGLQ